MKQQIKLLVNKKQYEIEVEPYWTLAELLRDELGLLGVKVSCNEGECGACTILLDREPICSCMALAVEADGKNIETIEGLSAEGELHPIQQAFIEYHGMQCGYCTPGMILSAKALLDKNPNPSEYEVREAISGNLCRCGAYPKIVKSVLTAAARMRGDNYE
ncbi:(2Fe-2S)-binding protein [Chloroflexota bacterium]